MSIDFSLQSLVLLHEIKEQLNAGNDNIAHSLLILKLKKTFEEGYDEGVKSEQTGSSG